MDIYQIKDALLIGFALAFMIGPVFFILLQTSITKGFRAALVFDIGVILGDIAFILLAYYGSRSLLERIKDDPRLFYIGGAILFVYGLITFLDKEDKEPLTEGNLESIPENNYTKLIIKGFFLNFINIGVLAFWLGMLVVIGPTLDMKPSSIAEYFGFILLGYFSTDVGKIFLAKQLKNKLTPAISYKIKRGMGILLMLIGIIMAAKGFIPKEKFDLKKVIEKVENRN